MFWLIYQNSTTYPFRGQTQVWQRFTYDTTRRSMDLAERREDVNTRQFVAISRRVGGWAGFYYFSDPFYHVATLRRRTTRERATPIRLRRPSKRDKSASADIAADTDDCRRAPPPSPRLTFRDAVRANRPELFRWNILRVGDVRDEPLSLPCVRSRHSQLAQVNFP